SMPSFMFIPQAWTISIEMMFYFIAPFIVRRKTAVIIVLFLLTAGLNIILQVSGFDYDPWTYRFFPAELLYFLAGVLGYKIWRMLPASVFSFRYAFPVFIAVAVFTFIYRYIHWAS